MIPEGSYSAQINHADTQTSQAGNEMIKTALVIDHEGETAQIHDYIVLHLDWKVEQVRMSLGMNPDDDLTPEAMIGKWVQVRIVHEEHPEYPTKPKLDRWTGPGEPQSSDTTDEGEEVDIAI